jgi:hypothetical protein
MFVIASALLLASPSSSSPWPLAQKAFNARCPRAESEELLTCGDGLIQASDRRIKRQLCRSAPRTCARRFETFSRKRRANIDRTLDAEGSVVSQLEAMWDVLETTLRFERSIRTASR